MCLYYSGVHIGSLHTPCCTAWNPCHTVRSVHVCIVLTLSFVLGPSSQPPTVPHPPHPEPTPPSSTLDDERSRKLKQVSVRCLLCALFLHCVKCVSCYIVARLTLSRSMVTYDYHINSNEPTRLVLTVQHSLTS